MTDNFSACNLSMADFLEEDDRTMFGTCDSKLQSTVTDCLYRMADLVNISVINSFSTLQQLHAYLDRLDLLDSEHLRPSWDSYFMVSRHVHLSHLVIDKLFLRH
jgi:dCMP deaminase